MTTKRTVDQTDQPSTESRIRSYYPALDGLRFVAFWLVFMHHTLVYGWLRPFGSKLVYREPYRFIGFIGWIGVDLFFAISGFLITDLLLQERKKFGQFSLKNFWIRRILRIWPLYFFVIAVIYGVLGFIPEFRVLEAQFGSQAYRTDLLSHVPYFALFLGNWSIIFNGWSTSGTLGLLWSVSMEEQFYVVWPPILKRVPLQYLVRILIGFWALNIVVRSVLLAVLVEPNAVSPIIYNPFAHGEPIILGILLAVFRTNKDLWRRLRNWHVLFPLIGVALIVGSLGLANIYPIPPTRLTYNAIWQYTAIALGCALLVAGCVMHSESPTPRSAYLLLKNPVSVWLGKISYGLYVYHLWGMIIGYSLLIPFQATYDFQTRKYVTDLGTDILWWWLSLGLTVAMAAASYYVLERRFLRLKSRFTRVESRPT